MSHAGEMFERLAVLTVGDKQFQTRLAFSVAKDREGVAPNEMSVKVYNLSRTSRQALESNLQKEVVLQAGYGNEGNLLQVFSGRTFYAFTERQNADLVTTLLCMSDPNIVQKTHIEFSGISTAWEMMQVVVSRLKSYGIAVGSIPEPIVNDLKGTRFKRPKQGSGRMSSVMRIATAGGKYRWSIDNGALHVYSNDHYVDDNTVVLNKETGLIGYPSKSQAGAKEAKLITLAGGKPSETWMAKSLLNPLLEPNRKVLLQTDDTSLQAELCVWKVTHTGDTFQGDWISEVELGKVGGAPYLGPVNDLPDE